MSNTPRFEPPSYDPLSEVPLALDRLPFDGLPLDSLSDALEDELEQDGSKYFRPARSESELRESVRFESKLREIAVRNEDGEQFSAEVLDESFGGLGLRVQRQHSVEIGSELELTYNGVRMWATVQNVTPTDDTAVRWGMAWKAVGIANRARRVCEPVAPHNTQDPMQRHLARFLDMLPGGLYMMWNLFEHAKWRELDEAAERLAISARRCGLQSISKPVDTLRQALRKGVRLGDLRKLLDALLEFCLAEANKIVQADPKPHA